MKRILKLKKLLIPLLAVLLTTNSFANSTTSSGTTITCEQVLDACDKALKDEQAVTEKMQAQLKTYKQLTEALNDDLDDANSRANSVWWKVGLSVIIGVVVGSKLQ